MFAHTVPHYVVDFSNMREQPSSFIVWLRIRYTSLINKVFEKDNSTFDNNGKFLPHIKNGIESFYTWFYKACEMSK